MDRKLAGSLRSALGALAAGMREAPDFFVRAEGRFVSGAVGHPVGLVRAGGGFLLSIGAEEWAVGPDGFADKVAEKAALYDSLELEVTERGRVAILTADGSGVRLRSGGGSAPGMRGGVGSGRDGEHGGLWDPDGAAGRTAENTAHIRREGAERLLKAIGIMTGDGKVRNSMARKLTQADRFVGMMGRPLEAMLSGRKEGDIPVILDCACGKSYLSFVLNHHVNEGMRRKCRFVCVDSSAEVIAKSEGVARDLGYANMEFHVATVAEYAGKARADMVISLHACDTATDEALALGVGCGAKALVCVPCCHAEMNAQYSYGPFAEV
ncbi:MAG: SAM-dependent methyltransferase, partial [Oscillospiraceae bacterium]|nr:SAM-dependent methyltransferase [Oscillospiraceae bacterium]